MGETSSTASSDGELVAVSSRMFENIRDQLVAGEFRVELFDCKAVQCVENEPLVFEGIGVVSQAKDGSIGFTLLCQKVDARFDPFVELFSDLEPGKLVEDRSRYNISGHDSLGIRWRCERQMLGVDQGQELRLTSNLTNLVAEQKSSRKELEREYQGWYFSGDLKMPTRPHSKKWEYERGSTSWKGVVDQHRNSELSFHAPQEGFKQRSEDFLRGVAMLCGRPLSPMCGYRFFGDRQVVEIFGRRRDPHRKVMVPFVPRAWRYATSWNEFLEAWISVERQVGDRRVQTFIFHHFARICYAQQEGIENGAQVLSSSIEGMLASLFMTNDDRDLEFARLIEVTLGSASSAGLNLDERIVRLLKKSKENAERPGIKSVFQSLIRRGLLNPKLFEAWNKIRHKAAHGELLGATDQEHQKMFDRFFICIETFKRLVFDVVGYAGTTVDYQKPGWPVIEKKLSTSTGDGSGP